MSNQIFYFDAASYCIKELPPADSSWVLYEWTSSTTPTLTKLEAEKEEPIGDDYDEGDEWADAMDAGAAALMGIRAEPTRPALDWNKPASTDRFPGFTVSSHTQDQQASNNHALQRCADFDGLVMKV